MNNKADNRKDVDTLAEWCEFVQRFKFERPGFEDILEMSLDGIKKAKERRDLRGLRIVYRDLIESVRGLRPEQQLELDRQLIERFGQGLRNVHEDLEKKALQILKRGAVKDADEYRVLESWLDFILNDPSRRDQVKRISTLLGTTTGPLPE